MHASTGTSPADAERWIEAARGGDAEGLGCALESLRDYLLLVAGRELDADLAAKAGASDLVQETFLAARRDFGRFGGRSRDELRAWLRQILKHHLANLRRHYRETERRRVGREVSLDVPAPGEGAPTVTAAGPSPSGDAMRRECAAALRAALDRLPGRSRSVIEWHFYEGLPFEEVGRRLHCSADAARKLWPRALARLRRELGAVHDPRR